MTDFSQNITLISSNTPVNPAVTVNVGTATGKVALATAFGVSTGSNFENFNTMDDAGFRTAWNKVGGFYFIRLNPDAISFTGMGSNTTAPTSITALDTVIKALVDLDFQGPNKVGMMGTSHNWPGFGQQDYTTYGNYAIQIAKYVVKKFTDAGKTNPFIYWEPLNEADGILDGGRDDFSFAFDQAQRGLAMKNAFAAAGAPYNTFKIAGPVTQNEPSTRPNFMKQFSDNLSSDFLWNFHYYAFGNHGTSEGVGAGTTSQINLAIDPTAGYGHAINAARAINNVPVSLTEYNMDGQNNGPSTPPSNGPVAESENWNGAVYNTLAILDAVKVGGLEFGGIWDLYMAASSVDCYGIFNGNNTTNGNDQTKTYVDTQYNLTPQNVDAYAIFPVAWTLGRLANFMPGNVVQTVHDASVSNVYSMATRDSGTGNFKCVCLVNYGTSDTLISLVINPGLSSYTYFEVSQNFPVKPYGTSQAGPKIQSTTPFALASLTLPKRSVIIISP